MGPKKKLSLSQKQNISGWIFLTPATVLIAVMSFYPMIRAIILSMQTGVGAKITFSGLTNYKRMFADAVFKKYIYLSNYPSPYNAYICFAFGIFIK